MSNIPNDNEEFDDFKQNEEFSDSDNDAVEDDEINLSDDEDGLDIVIEIDEDDINNFDKVVTESVDSENTDGEDIVLSKHKVEGKHALKYDSIFKGKKEDPITEDDDDNLSVFHKETIEVDKSSNYYFESIDNEQYVRTKIVKEKVYQVLCDHTNINFLNNRRKPSRSDFNEYYNLLKINLKEESFTNIELFNELSVYFSDNLFNMFKLLDNRYRNLILNELQDHIGRNKNSKEITNRNIYFGTEIEFKWLDEFDEIKLITGVVMETDYENSLFKVDSYENIYTVSIDDMTKILNNDKFKYNLNKLNNIDFL
jgi:hypothetical protein